jgi:hypothetical protein
MSTISPALTAMVARTLATAGHRPSGPAANREAARRIDRALTELAHTRPRIVVFAPREALRRAVLLAGAPELVAGVPASLSVARLQRQAA